MPITEIGRDAGDVVQPPVSVPRRWTWFLDEDGRPKLKDDAGVVTDFTGSTIYSDPGAPAGGLGKVTDFYYNETNGDFYLKTGASTWTLQGRIRGSQIYSDPGAPGGGLGLLGDFYVNETNRDYYLKTSDSVWTLQGRFPGSTFYTGAGAPADGTGLANDFYLNATNGDYYVKNSDGSWGASDGNIRGAQGIQGEPGVLTTIVAGDALTSDPPGGSAASVELDVNVDNSTIEISGDALRVKDGGITAAKVAADVATQAELDDHLNDTGDAHDASAVSFSPAAGIAATDVQAAIVEDAGDLSAHLSDTVDAHDASAISFIAGGSIAATDVQTAVAEVATDYIAADSTHAGASPAHAAAAVSYAGGTGMSATNVEAAIDELAIEKENTGVAAAAVDAHELTTDHPLALASSDGGGTGAGAKGLMAAGQVDALVNLIGGLGLASQGAIFNVKDYGAKGDDYMYGNVGTMTNGSGVLTISGGGTFTAADVGKTIAVSTAGNAGGTIALRTTIASFQSSTQVTLTNPCLRTGGPHAGLWVASWSDDTTAINNAIAAAAASPPGGILFFPPGRYAHNSDLTDITFNGLTIMGTGAQYTADSGDFTKLGGSTLVWRGTASNVIQIDAYPVSGVSGPALKGFRILGMGFEGRNFPGGVRPDTAVRIRSAHGWHIEDFYAIDYSGAAVDLNVLTAGSIGEAHDVTRGKMSRFCIRQLDDDSSFGGPSATGIGLRLGGSTTANACCNTFDTGQFIFQTNGNPAMQFNNSDSNMVMNVLCNRGPDSNGTGVGLQINGHASDAVQCARNNVFMNCSVGGNGLTVTNPGSPAIDNYFHDYQVGNGEPLPGLGTPASNLIANGCIFLFNTNGTQNGAEFSDLTGNSQVLVRNTATQTVGAAQVSLNQLFFRILQPGQQWTFDAQIIANVSASNSTSFGIGLLLPAGATVSAVAQGATNSVAFRNGYLATTTAQRSFLTTSGFTGAVRLSGAVIAGTATSHTGTVQLQAITSATATIQVGSFLNARQVIT